MPWYLNLIILLVLGSLGLTSLSLAPWVPTRKKDLKRICALVGLKPGEKFYDLGCGDGRLVMYAGKNFDIKAIGVELAIPFYLFCVIRKLFDKKKNVAFKFNDLYSVDLRDADVVYIFARDEKKLNGKLIDKLEKELKPEARVITYVFPVRAWQPIKVDKPTDKDLPIYLYVR